MKQFFRSKLLLLILFLGVFHFLDAQTIIYSDAYDLTNGYSYEGVFTITDENTPTGMDFSADGSKMYIVGKFHNKIFQYSLSVPFDVTSTITLDGSKNVGTGANENPTGIAFNGDGTVLFSIGEEYDRIITWNLPTPFDITDGLISDGSTFISSFEAVPEDIAFNSDGSRRYVIGRSGDDINQTNNSSPYNLTFGINGTFSVASETLAPFGMAMSGDDQIMLVSSSSNIIQYSLSTPGEVISGVSLDELFFNYSGSFTPQGVAFNDDGSKFYVLVEPSGGAGSISQFSINIADENFTESNLADGSVDGSATMRISGETFTSAGGNLTSGTDFTITNLPTGLIPAIAVSADGKLATLTFTGNALSSQDSDDVASIAINFSNSAFTGNDASVVSNSVSASTGFKIDFTSSEIVYASPTDIQGGITFDQTASISGEDALYNLDGTKLFVLGETGDNVSQYSLSTPFIIDSGTSLDGMFDVGNEETTPTGFFFSNSGNKMFVVGSSGDDVYQYNLSQPFDVTATVSFEGSFSVSNQENNPQGISFNSDGSKMYIIGHQTDEVNQYSLTNNFDITSGVSFDGSPLIVTSVDSNPTDLAFNADGTKLFVVGFSQKDINQYNLSIPFDITSGVTFESQTFPDLQFDFTPIGLSLSPNGNSFLVINSDISQYNFDATGFEEDAINDGSLDGSITIKLINASFSNAGSSLTHGSDFNIVNLPAGLVPALTVASNGTVATLTLGGIATSSDIADDVSDLRFTFENSAFTNNNASAISGTTNASSSLGISFITNPALTYGYEAFAFDAGLTHDGESTSLTNVPSGDNIEFNDDGTRIFVTNTSSQVFQFDLDIPYDVTNTVSLSGSKTLSSSQRGIAFNNDGSKMYELRSFLNSFQPRVIEYSLASPFDVTSTSTVVSSYTIIAQESSPAGIAFSKDGSKMYVVGGNGLHQYTLSTPFSLASVSFDGTESISGGPTDIVFSNDGSTMFILGTSFDNVARQSMNTPFDITAGFTSAGDAFSVAAQNAGPRGLAFDADGSMMYIVGSGSRVEQYSIEVGGFNEVAANDGTLEGELNIRIERDVFTNAGSTLSSPTDFTITNLPSGLTPVLNVAADGLSAVLQITGSAGTSNISDISSLNFTFENSTFTTNPAAAVTNGINAESNFGIDFIDSPELTYGFDSFDLNATVTNDGSPFSIASEEGNAGGIAFSQDGFKMFIIGLANDNVYQYSLTTAFDVTSSVSFDGSFSVSTQEANPTGVKFSNDGHTLFIIGATGRDVNQYSVSLAFDVTSMVVFQGNYSVISQETAPQDFTFSSDGTKMFVVGSTGDDVNQYTLSTPFDITGTVTFDGTPLSVASEETVPSAIAFSNDGLTMFILGLIGDDVNQYRLATAFDVTAGGSYETTYSVSGQETTATGLAFSADGSRFFVVGSIGDDVNQYTVNQEKFTEAVANDGSIDGSLTIKIFNDTFTNAGSNLTGSDYSIDNLPSGLSSTLAVAADGLSASLTLGGNATNNFDSDDIASLQFTFENSTFTNTSAANVINAISAESNVGIDFFGTVSAPTDISLDNTSIDENEAIGTVVGTLSTTDVDAGETYTYTLVAGTGDADNTSFAIDGDELKSAAMFDFETKDSYSIRVNTNDGNGGDFAKEFIISVNDLAETITWSGTAWSNGAGPSASDDAVIDGDYSVDTNGSFEAALITINTGNTLTVDAESTLDVVGGLVNSGSLAVESGSSLLTYAANSVSGNDIEIGRDTRYADGKYSFVGTPVEQDASIIGSDLGTFVFKYNEVTPYGMNEGLMRWEMASADELVPGKGYTQANQKEIVFLGTPNTGTINYNGTYTEDTDDANEGWNLVANPYAAAISVSSFLTENMNTSGSVYIWDDNGSATQRGSNADYIVANASMATTTAAGGQSRYNFHLGSAQGFFIKFDNNSDTEISFTEGMRVSGNNADGNFFRKEPLPIARLNLTDSKGLFKQTVIGFAVDATENNLNRRYDAQPFNATSDNGLFTVKAGRSLTLNGMTTNWESIQLQLNAKEAGLYTMSVELEGYDQSIYLKDNLTGVILDLRNEAYSFSIQAGIDTDRFELISSPNDVLGLVAERVLVYASESTLYIRPSDNALREYQIFNLQGKQLISTSAKGKRDINLQSLSSGIYLVFDGKKTHKIILQ